MYNVVTAGTVLSTWRQPYPSQCRHILMQQFLTKHACLHQQKEDGHKGFKKDHMTTCNLLELLM